MVSQTEPAEHGVWGGKAAERLGLRGEVTREQTLINGQDQGQPDRGPGHMTVAAIAYRDLSPVERQKLDAILGSHPQFQSWLNDFPDNVPNSIKGFYVAMAASLWPDQIRNHNDPSTFPNWHFVDYPLIAPSFPDRGSRTPQDDVSFGIGKSEAIL